MPDSPSIPIKQTQTLPDDLAPTETWIDGLSGGEIFIIGIVIAGLVGLFKLLLRAKEERHLPDNIVKTTATANSANIVSPIINVKPIINVEIA